MMAVPMRVTGAWIQLLTDWLDLYQLPAPELRVLLDSRRPGDAVSVVLWQQLLQRAVALCPDRPAPALDIGAQVRPRHVGVLGYLSLASRTLGEAMLNYQRYEQLFYGRQMVEVVQQRGLVEMRWLAVDSTGRLADSVAIAALIGFLRRLVAEDVDVQEVRFVFPAPSALEQACYVEFFGCPVQFSAPHTAVVLSSSLLSRRLPHNDPGVRLLLDLQAQALLLALPSSDSFDRALQQTLVRRLPEGDLSLQQVAAELHMSVRTLQRRLNQRGLSWRNVLDRTRQQLAQQYLADPALMLGDIALLLGFSEQSAFNRAFRRWTGSTPARARRRM